jgi:hypothetical protein
LKSTNHIIRHNALNDLWLISCYYNPNQYLSITNNFNRFIGSVENANLNYLIVECTFGEQDFILPKSRHIIKVRTSDVLWQKERLLNIALANLPDNCKKVVWIDCDVLFENPDWARETSARLDHARVIQPFREAVRLPEHAIENNNEGERYFSFAYIYQQDPLLVSDGNYNLHGHTGFAWATHKKIIQRHGLYDVCLSGNADHLMAHSFVGRWDTACTHRVIGANRSYFDHYTKWSKEIYGTVNAEVDFVDGLLLHLWHGDLKDRNYTHHQKALAHFEFNPSTDIVLNEAGCWQWNHSNAEFKNWAKDFYASRKED